jgi:hypothetical protein
MQPKSRNLKKRRKDIAAKRARGEKLTLDEKRIEEAEDAKVVLKKHKKDMLHIKDWLENNFKDK